MLLLTTLPDAVNKITRRITFLVSLGIFHKNRLNSFLVYKPQLGVLTLPFVYSIQDLQTIITF